MFFNTITKALNIVGDLIIYQKASLKEEIANAQNTSMSSLVNSSLLAIFGITLILVFIYFLSKSITGSIKNVSQQLDSDTSNIIDTSNDVFNISSDINAASNEQAASLQETAASLNEISSMIQRNADASDSSAKSAKKSEQEVQKGKQQMDEMILAIKDIAHNNEEMLNAMNNNSDEINKITDVITNISEKTKVINDIVFQTKLLSFNASVEAARAGEHGKGFAVVAEEVGNLAAMSGKAALEISQMLEGSVEQVNGIVDKSKTSVDHLMLQSKNKINNGTKIADQCGLVLENILQNTKSVNEMINEIATASREQSLGVAEVTKAMQQLDELTHKNSHIAQEMIKMSKILKNSSDNLDHVVGDLAVVVDGNINTNKPYKRNSNQKFNNENYKETDFSGLNTHEPISNNHKFVSTETNDRNITNNPNVIAFQQNKTSSKDVNNTQTIAKKVVGLDVPVESDSRFEDL